MKNFVVIGGGAAGFFGSLAIKEIDPTTTVTLLEKHAQLLSKVRISGGGRCNVTHACFDPKQLVQNYPRGNKALIGPFTRFQPLNTLEWFESRGVKLKTEADGRIFPITDNSETIIQCLLNETRKSYIKIRTECGVIDLKKEGDHFLIYLNNGEILKADKVLLTTGSSQKTFEWLKNFGHTITLPIPSLFTFNIPHSNLKDIAGVSVEKVSVSFLENTELFQTGPLLITHWGVSGPAVLKLSAWGARALYDLKYKATLKINWLPDENVEEKLQQMKKSFPKRAVFTESPFTLPKSLWKKLCEKIGVSESLRFVDLSNNSIKAFNEILHHDLYKVDGKSTNKDEFVTAGGVHLDEVNFKTMESKKVKNLFFAGEVLDIDGVTGGFNFQNAWTTSWIAGRSMAE